MPTDEMLEENLTNQRQLLEAFGKAAHRFETMLSQQRVIIWQRIIIMACAVGAVAMFGGFLWRVSYVLDDLNGVATDNHSIQTDNHSILTEIQKVTNIDAVKQRNEATLAAIRDVILCIENNQLRIDDPTVPLRANCPTEQGN